VMPEFVSEVRTCHGCPVAIVVLESIDFGEPKVAESLLFADVLGHAR
jgi:hypothetical protein